MDSQEEVLNNDNWIKFLLAEHSYFADSFWRSEEVGEKRISYLTGLVTAFLATLLALGKLIPAVDSSFYLFSIASLLFLLVIGILVFLRMIHRSKKTDEWKARLDLIRACFRSEIPREGYKPFTDEVLTKYLIDKARIPTRMLRRGGLTATALVINTFLSAALGLFFVLYLGHTDTFLLVLGVISFGVISSLLQSIHIMKTRGN